jgi:cell division protein FtsB
MGSEKAVIASKLRNKRKWITALALLVMALFGYLLANAENAVYRQEIASLKKTIAGLNTENHLLTQKVHQTEASQMVCESERNLQQTSLQTTRNELKQCEQDIGFYQHVLAPELGDGMLGAYAVSVLDLNNTNTLRLSMVLLQPRAVKRVISGTLKVTLSNAGKTRTLNLGEISYRFKYFQNALLEFDLPTDFTPDELRFSSDVIQYKRVREQYEQSFHWSDITSTPELSSP